MQWTAWVLRAVSFIHTDLSGVTLCERAIDTAIAGHLVTADSTCTAHSERDLPVLSNFRQDGLAVLPSGLGWNHKAPTVSREPFDPRRWIGQRLHTGQLSHRH